MSVGDMLWEDIHYYGGYGGGRTYSDHLKLEEARTRAKIRKIYEKYPDYDKLPKEVKERIWEETNSDVSRKDVLGY
jgi:hypothetical protein